MRARLIPVSAAVFAAVSCFQVDPLPECPEADREGALYLAGHVCMPLGGTLDMPVAPRRLLRGDFDDEGVDNDFAVLLDLGYIAVYPVSDATIREPIALQAGGRVEAITATRFFAGGEFGDDLIGVIAGDPMTNTAGTVFGFHNGGNGFDLTTPDTVSAVTLVPFLTTCPLPNSVETIDVIGQENATAIAIGCQSGPPPMDMPDSEPLDGIVVFADPAAAFDGLLRVGLQIPGLTGVHAVNVAQLDGLELEDIVLAHQPEMEGKPAEHQELAVYPVHMDDMMANPNQQGFTIPLEHGIIDRVLVEDLDSDADIDLVAVHNTGRGISVVRQRRSEPLDFEDPQFFDVDQEILDAVIGDFTGDDGIDIAVAHEVDGTGLNGVSFLVRLPNMSPGTVDYALVHVGSVSGEIVDLEPMDFDGDGRTDIAAVVKSGSQGKLHFWLNRSPAGG